MIQFWFLWIFIAFVVVIVAFTLRRERDDMPRKDILRAVETNAGSMGLAEKLFLWAFSWLDTRFRIQDYWGMSKDSYYSMHRQMPLTHAEKYKLRIIWYWYPLYCLGGISFLAFIILVITGTILGFYYVPGGDLDSDPTPAYASMEFIMLELPFGYIIRSIHHWGTHFFVAAVFLHMCQSLLHWSIQKPQGTELVDRSRSNVLLDFLRLLGIFAAMGQFGLWGGHHRHQHGHGHPADWGVGG